MPRRATYAEVLAAVGALPGGGPRFVGIDGAGGAGKSSLAQLLADGYAGVVVISTDDLQGPGIAEWDWPRLRRQVVTPLLDGRAGRYEIWAWGETEPRGRRTVPPASVVVIEGVSAIRRDFDVPWDVTVWVDTPRAVRRSRTLDRDGPATLRLWEEHWWPSEEAYLAREHPQQRADLIVDGNAADR